MAKPDATERSYKHIHIIKSKKPGGEDYVYAWRGGPRIKGAPYSDESIANFRAECSKHKLGVEGTLKGLIDDYRKAPKWNGIGRKALAARTRENYDMWFKRIEAKFGGLALIAFDDQDIREQIILWRDSYAAQPRTADMGAAAFSALLSFGIERRRISQNYAKGIPKLYESERSYLIWRPQDMEALAKVASPAIWEVAKLASLTGLRQADLLKLRWDDLDEDAADVNTGKSRGRNRAMIVRYPALDAFLTILDGAEKKTATVLQTNKGKPWKGQSGFRASWRRATAKALEGIEDPKHRAYFESLHFHDLRGTAATELSAAGMSNALIAMFLGWTEEAVTELLKRYVDRKTVAQKVRLQLAAAHQPTPIPTPANSDQNSDAVKDSVKNEPEAISA